ncbi:hypothetical protein SAMN06265375_101626 [Muriicola jejuensis]|nr:hypothetical protein SAMN06265375_101626 [Muriicola jejuensis]
MDTQTNQTPSDEKVQVYRNDFYHGILQLAKKLFMF